MQQLSRNIIAFRIASRIYIGMNSELPTKAEAANAIGVLRAGFHSSTEAVRKVEQYIRHLEELLLEELGQEGFKRRLECLVLRDQRREESLFIAEDSSVPRKRGSSITESGSLPKKARSELSVSSLNITPGLGRSILENGRRRGKHCDWPNVSPKTSVSEYTSANPRQTTTNETPVRLRGPSRRGGQSALLPNKQPSSNFHSGPGSTLTSESSTPTASPLAAHTCSPPLSARKDSVQSGTSSKQPRRSNSVASTRNTPLFQGPTSSTLASKRPIIIPPRLRKKPVLPSDKPSTSLATPSASSDGASPSPVSDRPSSSSSKSFSLPDKSGSGSSRPLALLEQQQQPLSLTRKPWRASKK